jgi:hypothetical protein
MMELGFSASLLHDNRLPAAANINMYALFIFILFSITRATVQHFAAFIKAAGYSACIICC